MLLLVFPFDHEDYKEGSKLPHGMCPPFLPNEWVDPPVTPRACFMVGFPKGAY